VGANDQEGPMCSIAYGEFAGGDTTEAPYSNVSGNCFFQDVLTACVRLIFW